VLVLGAAVAAGWFGYPALGFALLAAAALAIETGDALRRLGRSIFVSETRASRLSFMLHLIWDGTLVTLGALAIDGSRAHRLFAPLVTVGVLHVPPAPPEAGWRALADDRGLIAMVLAVSSAFGFAEGGVMLLALLLIALRIAAPAGERG